jgi:diguanylate cyclase (GGDEF)-like protein/PAS domain S-box-containing protein
MSASAPAVVARADGTIVAANPQSQGLMEHGRLASALQTLLIDARLKGATVTAKMSLQANGETEGARRFDLVFLPLPCGDVLIIGREATLEANLTTALAASRELFRDLALCFNDFAFETDAAGLFTWASPEGVLGYSSNELHGSRVREIVGDIHPNPFSARDAFKAAEVWVTTKTGDEACVSVTSSPVRDAQGEWRGTRGVARNVTALKLQERGAAHSRKRDELIAAVVNAVRAQVEPRRMMLAAADALAGAMESDFVSIKALGTDLVASVGAEVEAFKLEAATSYQGKSNGNVRLARGGDSGAYGEAEKSLFDAVLPHLGIALALAQSLESGTQSRTDAATGLLNRRAFGDEAKRLFGAAARAARSTALLIVDCDNLSDAGDGNGDLLCAIGRSLLDVCGEHGVAGRMGSERFALLIDPGRDVGELAATVRTRIHDLCQARGLGGGITASIGAAVAEPEAGEDLAGLIGRAERAQQSASREGERRVALPPVQGETSC